MACESDARTAIRRCARMAGRVSPYESEAHTAIRRCTRTGGRVSPCESEARKQLDGVIAWEAASVHARQEAKRAQQLDGAIAWEAELVHARRAVHGAEDKLVHCDRPIVAADCDVVLLRARRRAPDPVVALADGHEPHPLLRVQRDLLVRATQQQVLPLAFCARLAIRSSRACCNKRTYCRLGHKPA